jgi:hypothetical protein
METTGRAALGLRTRKDMTSHVLKARAYMGISTTTTFREEEKVTKTHKLEDMLTQSTECTGSGYACIVADTPRRLQVGLDALILLWLTDLQNWRLRRFEEDISRRLPQGHLNSQNRIVWFMFVLIVTLQ